MIKEETNGKVRVTLDDCLNLIKYFKVPRNKRTEVLAQCLEIMYPEYHAERERRRARDLAFESNPKNRKKFAEDYKLVDFIPIFGTDFHNSRNWEKLHENSYFYRRANEGLVPFIKKAAYNTCRGTIDLGVTFGVLVGLALGYEHMKGHL